MQHQQAYLNQQFDNTPTNIQQSQYGGMVQGIPANNQYPQQGQMIYQQPQLGQLYPGLQDQQFGVPIQQGMIIVQYQSPQLPRTADGMQYPGIIQCPYCNNQSQTYMKYRMSLYSWLTVFLLLIIFFPLMWLPCCMKSQKNKHYYCCSCGNKVGRTNYTGC